MRKHFLILMLLTLLPLAGWAADFSTEATVTVDDIYFSLGLDVDDVNLQVNGVQIADIQLYKEGGQVVYFTSKECTTKVALADGSLTPNIGTNYWVKVLPSTSANSGWAAGKVIVKAMPLKITVANASKAFNNKGTEDTDEELGAITAITQLDEDGNDDALEGAALTAMIAKITVGREAGKTVKNYKYTASFTTATDNYTIATPITGTFSITKRDFPAGRGTTGNTYSVTVTDNEKTYSGSNQTATVTVVDNAIGYTLPASDYTVKYDGSATAKNYKEGGYVISFTTKGSYNEVTKTLNAEGDKKLLIAQKALDIYVDDATKVYDGTDDIPATVTFSYSGLVGDDIYEEAPFGNNFDAVYSDPTGDEALTGIYGLKAKEKTTEEAVAALAASTYPNYAVTFTEIGQLTVTERPVKITVADAQKSFGTADPTPVSTFTVAAADGDAGALTSEATKIYDVTQKVWLERAYKVVRNNTTETVGPQTKALELQAKSDEEMLATEEYELNAAKLADVKEILAQYNIDEKKGKFTINAASLTVTPKKVTKTYGESYDLADFEVIATNSAGQRVTLTSTPTVEFKEAEYNEENPTDANVYIMVVAGDITADGYDGEHATRNEGQFIIKKKELTAVLDDQVLMVGDDKDDLLSSKVSFVDANDEDGIVGDDVIDFELSFNVVNVAADGKLTSGTHVRTQAQADDANADLEDAIAYDEWAETFSDETAADFNEKLGLEEGDDNFAESGEAPSDAQLAAAKAYNELLDGAQHAGELLAAAAEVEGGFAKGIVIEVAAESAGFANKNYKITIADVTGALTVITNTALTLNLDDDDAINIAKLDGEAVTVAIDFSNRNGRALGGERSWKAGSWNTLVLPFDITVAQLSQKLGYAIVNVIDPSRTEVNGTSSTFYGKLTMKGGNGSETKLVANKPILVKTADDIDGIVNFGEQTIVAPADADDLSVDAGKDCKFVGTYTTRTVTKDDEAKIWFTLGNYAKWAFIDTDSENSWDILPTEAYIDMSEAAGVRSMTFIMEELDGSTTTIGSINADNAASKQNVDGWFTLNGVKLQGAPTEKGIYINNGKKVVIK